MQRANASYTFGRFQLDAADRRLLCDGQPISLTPKAFDTLLVLVQHAGHTLSKDDLMRAVWPDGFVEETNLSFNISTLRKALADGQAGEQYIETVPKLGYRFVMPVQSETPRPKHTNLPAQLTRFIGREKEMADVTTLVQKKRLVTLTGSGGVGKTRLAMEAGGQVMPHFADGVWLAEFAPLADEALVLATVAGVFGLQEQSGRSLLDMLVGFIGEKHMLLIFDNCEHLIDAIAKLVDALLCACLNLHILATSREALRVAGEMVWRVPSLDVPDANSSLSLEQISEFDAVELFVEHAALVQAGFGLTQDNLEPVVGICRRLDGIPQAIGMAAAQLDALDLSEIEKRLENCFDLLTQGSRTAVPRHQTLRATLDWSYNLLSEPERALLARLSVFRGGFTAEAAQAVCNTSHQTLLQLVRKSLVMPVVKNEFDDQPRYRLLETNLFYAREKLCESGELETMQDRHLQYFLKLAEEPIELAGPRVDPWVRRMDVELDNVRAAFARAMQRNDHAEMAMCLVRAMSKYRYHCGHMTELKAWAEQAWEQGENASVFARARGKLALASMYVMSGAKTQGIRYAEEALILFRQSNDRYGLAECLEVLANNAFDEHVQAYAEEALVLSREIGSVDGESRALRALGIAAFRAGDRAKAASLLEQAIRIADWDILAGLHLLHEVDPERALAWCAGERSRFNSSTDAKFAASVLQAYGTMLLTKENDAQVPMVFEQAVRGWEQVGKRHPLDLASLVQPLPPDISPLELEGLTSVLVKVGYSLLGLGFAELSLGNITIAQARLQQSCDFARQEGGTCQDAIAKLLQIHLRMLDHQIHSLRSESCECLRNFNSLGDPLGTMCALVQLAGIVSRSGEASDMKLATQLLGTVFSCTATKLSVTMYESRILIRWLKDAEGSIIAPALAAARAALGDAKFERCYAAGQRMSRDEAVALALNG